MSFSKKIYLYNLIFVISVVIASFCAVYFSGMLGIVDLSPITVICTSSFGELAVANVFYYRKAQAENVIKISKQIQDENIDASTVDIANQVMNSDFGSSM